VRCHYIELQLPVLEIRLAGIKERRGRRNIQKGELYRIAGV
jgi:hypothetical protein